MPSPMKLIVTVDTEADNQWDHGCSLSTENVHYWKPFQAMCERYGVRPTYLITSEIAVDPVAISFLRPLVKKNKIEVGTHLHPWTTPPFINRPGLRYNDSIHAFPSQLEPKLLESKIITLTEQITNAVDKQPTSFRAGRYGFNRVCANILKRLGYVVDSSVTPMQSWENHPGLPNVGGGPDFSSFSVKPYLIVTKDKEFLLEIPITIVVTNYFLRQFPSLLRYYQKLEGILSGSFFRLNCLAPQPLWLRPLPKITLNHLLSVWREARRLSLPAIVMMFHSSELMPGASPYRPTKESVSQLLDLLAEFFSIMRKNDGQSTTLTDAAKIILKLPNLENKIL